MTQLQSYLFKEGSWFILSKQQCGKEMHTYPHESLIWHECQAPHKPPGYKGIWRLHNWETTTGPWFQNADFYVQSHP